MISADITHGSVTNIIIIIHYFLFLPKNMIVAHISWTFVDIYINVLLAGDHNPRPCNEQILRYKIIIQYRRRNRMH